MKDFLKMMLAVICAIIVLTVLSIFIFGGAVGAAMSSMGGQSAVIPEEGVLKLDMSSITFSEQTSSTDILSSLSENSGVTLGILDAVRAIKAAAEDPGVKYIYLKTDMAGCSLATASELRKALSDFRTTSGKAVVSYIETPTTGSYYLTSVSDKVYMTRHPGASSMMTGVSTQMLFIGDLLKELGVNVQLIRHGKYKSAGEMFTRNSSSPENLEQYQAMVSSLWKTMSEEIAASRGISTGELNGAIDSLKLCLPQDFVDRKLVDELMDRSELESKLADLAVKEDYEDIDFIDFYDYATSLSNTSKARQKIAVIFANGEIIDGSDTQNVAGDHFASIIEKVRKDDKVKAVVLRVNSPGGSVLASEKIKQQLDLLKEEKPLIASYGDYAASGGYWISSNCEKIYSDAMTLTGSIGVFGMVPDLGKLAKDKLHVGVETVSSNKHGDMYSLTRPFDAEEYNFMLRSIEDIYDRFTTLVSEGRGIDKEQVDAIGQGRVWTGADALNINLVDEIGTLEDAIQYAAVSGGDPDLANWKIKEYPAVKTQAELLLEKIEGTQEDFSVRAMLKDLKEVKMVARMPYEIKILK